MVPAALVVAALRRACIWASRVRERGLRALRGKWMADENIFGAEDLVGVWRFAV